MTDQPDHIHRLDTCPACDGLRVTRLDRIDGVTSVELDDDSGIRLTGPLTVYLGPAPGECPQPADTGETT